MINIKNNSFVSLFSLTFMLLLFFALASSSVFALDISKKFQNDLKVNTKKISLGNVTIDNATKEKDITIEDLRKEKVIKIENFKIGNVSYERNYITEDEYYVTCVKDNSIDYYVNILKIYPLVKYAETVNPDYVSEELANKKFVAMYFYRSDHFITEFDLMDVIPIKVSVDGNEKILGNKCIHFRKLEK